MRGIDFTLIPLCIKGSFDHCNEINVYLIQITKNSKIIGFKGEKYFKRLIYAPVFAYSAR